MCDSVEPERAVKSIGIVSVWNNIFVLFSPVLNLCDGLNFWEFDWIITEGKLPTWDNYWP